MYLVNSFSFTFSVKSTSVKCCKAHNTAQIIVMTIVRTENAHQFTLKCRGYSKSGIEAYECRRFDHLSCEKPPTGNQLSFLGE